MRYKIERSNNPLNEDALNELGSEGWMLVSVLTIPVDFWNPHKGSRYEYTFMRPPEVTIDIAG